MVQTTEDPCVLFAMTIPVLGGVLDRLAASLLRAERDLGPERLETALLTRPAPGMLPITRQAATCAQFTVRIALPLVGRRAPELRGGFDLSGLLTRIEAARCCLGDLGPDDFAGAGDRIIRFQAGFADLELPGHAYLTSFGLPNLFFHQAMVHVGLKQAGVRIGKADFDGQHEYPEAFSFG